MPDCSGEPVVTTSCAFYFLHARLRVQRAPGIPCALCFGGQLLAQLGRIHAARSRVCVRRRGWFTSPRLRGEVGDGAKQSLRVRGTIRESEPVESPPHPLARCSRPLPSSGARGRTAMRSRGLLAEPVTGRAFPGPSPAVGSEGLTRRRGR